MILYPAIDIKDGKCVRLRQGNLNDEEIFNTDPVNQAKIFENFGFRNIHIVDLNGAVQGKSVNTEIIKSIRKNISIPIQLGGGIRDMKSVEEWFNIGINRIILGTAAVNKPDLLRESCNIYPKKIILGIDSRLGKVATDGWTKTTKEDYIKFALKFRDLSLYAIIFTDISRDGMMQGINIKETIKLADSIDIPIIASGGIKDIDDIKLIAENKNRGIMGAILGKAYYSGSIDPYEVLKITS
ncbi:MAG: 1-(5-phosphoribosyl)-5-[(5-phosphoribosylamino)methylideneamino] imidazole-4-carboxamide isomerase [Alphaproteobacteria bacterium MarineAlpha2_Bin1]|nr:MAG: 1-(5-phosphoribosyl)-5-[(5-phosphoribosylamino)methylideneamino] imidazole-4-carboxamide isomerase [Alphaproteobacteria bacterium MarineAlpha2_Bin1]|tara:strand:+ start:926 stop:1648 length:723 start_codon:yes stop_codon:yes gene_type:complete